MINLEIPSRHVLTILGFFGFIFAFSLRAILNVAIVAMVKEPDRIYSNSTNENSDACIELIETNHNSSLISIPTKDEGEFEWDSNLQGLVLGSFYYGYVATNIPGGVIAGLLGPKRALGIGVLVTSLLSFIIPVMARWNVWALVSTRIVQGLAEGVTFPSAYILVSRWAPKGEISQMAAWFVNGTNVGTVLSMYVSGFLCESDFLGGWPSTFYVFGLGGCVWFILWMLLVFDTPNIHPRISKEELSHILQGKEDDMLQKPPIPWKFILRSRVFWGLVISHFADNWGFYTLFTELPTYLSNVLNFSISMSGTIVSIFTILCAMFTHLSCVIADKLVAQGRLSTTTIRKLMTSLGAYVPAICLLIVAFIGCRREIITVCLALAVGMNGFIQAGILVTHVDISHEHAGVLIGLTGGISNLSGFLAPSVVGYLIHGGNTLTNWRNVFVLTFAIFFVSGTSYNLMCNCERQDWGIFEKLPKLKDQPSVKRKVSSTAAV